MAFSTETAALMALGYSLVSINNRRIVFPAGLDADGLAYVSGLLTKIAALDVEMDSNLSDSMAVKVQDLGLDYNRYLAQARARGSRYLQELSTALSTPVAFDKYSGVSSGSGSITVRNYY